MAHERAEAVLARIPTDRKIVGAEIGVLSGRTSAALLRARPLLFLHLIDSWIDHGTDHRFEKAGGVSPGRSKPYPQSWWDERYQATLDVTHFARARRKLIRMHSEDAVSNFEDGSLDFAYIDADHTLEACTQDIELWWPKIKPGGFLCGHDYDHRDKRWGVKEAVDTFIERVQLPLKRGIDMTWFVHKPKVVIDGKATKISEA